MMEVISKIKEAEANADAQRRRALQEARDMESAAQEESREAVASAKAKAAQEAERLVAEAQRKADELVAAKMAEARADGEKIRSRAQSHLETAAKLIVERIVAND